MVLYFMHNTLSVEAPLIHTQLRLIHFALQMPINHKLCADFQVGE